jgi:3-oxoacyl-[acyl-carrier-protein] synthase II
MRRALADARVPAESIDYVNAHGTGTRLNDAMESKALAEVLGARLAEVPVSSSKGQLGHTLGAAGAIEAVVTALSIHGGFVPPTTGLADPDPECPLRHVRGQAERRAVRFALSSSFGFGGNDAALVLSAAGEAPAAPRGRHAVVVTGLAGITPELPGALGDACKGSLDAARARRMDPMSRLACAVVGAALADAGLAPLPGNDVGLALGTALGALDESCAFMARVLDKGPRLAPPADFPNLVLSAPSAHASIYHRLEGLHLSLSGLGASGDLALGAAFDQVASGAITACVAGGVEQSAHLRVRLLGAFTTAADGTRAVATEGAAMLVLEAEEGARARGATVRARLLGWGAAGDPLDGRGQTRERTARALRSALAHARVAAEAIVAVVATHERAEVERAVEEVLGRADVPIDVLAERLGFHEALGAEAARVAALRAGAEARPVVTLGLAPGQSIAVVFGPP